MNKHLFNYLEKFYPGAQIDEINREVNSSKEETARLKKGNSILDISVDNNFYEINRGYKFSNKDKYLLGEVIEHITNLEKTELGQQYSLVLTEQIFDNAVFKYFFDQYRDKSNKKNDYLPFCKDLMKSISYWRNKTYETKNVNFGLIIETGNKPSEPEIDGTNINILDVLTREYLAPLSDGINTFIRIRQDGSIIGLEQIDAFVDNSNLPYRFSAISRYSSERIIILSRVGDILLISQGKIQFIKKDKQWIQYNSERIGNKLTEKVGIHNSVLRDAIYLTCLDVSLAKTGGVIGIVQKNKFDLQHIISQEISSNPEYQQKISFFQKIIKRKKFYEIERLIRKELTSIDGSLIIDNEGTVLSIGTIVKIDGGSLGGGRTAAAIILSRYGAGIKISSDGYIALYKGGNLAPTLRVE